MSMLRNVTHSNQGNPPVSPPNVEAIDEVYVQFDQVLKKTEFKRYSENGISYLEKNQMDYERYLQSEALNQCMPTNQKWFCAIQ